MAELPFELQRLPQQALDVLRYYSTSGNAPADEDVIAAATGLSSRGLGKAIKRLVTRKFAEMDVHRRYTLTDKGLQLMEQLLEYDAKTGGGASSAAKTEDTPSVPTAIESAQRHFSIVVPEPLVANETATVYIGIDRGFDGGQADIIVRLSSIHADLSLEQVALAVSNGAAYTSFDLTPGEFSEVRLRFELLQSDNFSGDLYNAGGMYVDVDVALDPSEAGQLAAFGTDITLTPAIG